MSVEQQVDALATSVDELTGAVITKKAALDASVVDAQSATAQAQDARTNTLSARDQAGAFKEAAYTAAQSAASAVAYQDLTALAESKDVTAVDLFIYDTAKDSDGGAWRHRCAGTSWYREPLNTATRGGRREFPAVAVIVAEANKVTIYDGDDPALPMWMVFGPRTGDGFMAGSTLTGSAEFSPYMHFFDGKMALSTSLGADIADFIADELIRHPISGGVGGVENGILNRSATAAASGDVTALGTPERVLGVGLVAARNAPICPKSKLPTPHIFVGGEVFTSIAPDGSKAEIGGGTSASGLCSFSKDFICLARDEDGNKLQVLGGNTVAVDADGGNSNTAIYAFTPETNSFSVVAYGAGKAELPFSSLFAFNLLYIDPTKFQNTFAAGITSTYTTGWMPGHIKGAFLSDTDDADLVGDGTLTAPDRSVAGKPLLVVGTITRAPVATGAELIAYNGFSEANYLEGTDASYVDTLYALGWEQTNGVWGFKHGVVSAAPIDGLTITGTTLKIAGTKPKALIRLTATVPTADQLAKIEADERPLFQENAACTLNGASSAVTALAHDPDTGLLHVGTLAGRSVFKGLRRVANTTVPVGAAIAAAGGMVVEE